MVCWFPTRKPTTTKHRVMGRMRSRPPPRTTTRQRTRRQSDRRDTPTLNEPGPQLTYRTVSYDVNTVLLQHALNLPNIIRIHAGNTNAAVDIAITALKNFELKRDTIQTENNVPAQ